MPKFTTRDIITPKEGATVYLNRYWNCIDNDPKQALFYGDIPQCNKEETLTRPTNLMKSQIEGNITTIFLPVSYVIRPDNWG